MTCEEAIEMLAEVGDGAPALPNGWRFKLHLWICRNCRKYAATYLQTVQLEKMALEKVVEQPPKLPEDLVQQILAERHRELKK